MYSLHRHYFENRFYISSLKKFSSLIPTLKKGGRGDLKFLAYTSKNLPLPWWEGIKGRGT
jgi:hypothetical protein